MHRGRRQLTMLPFLQFDVGRVADLLVALGHIAYAKRVRAAPKQPRRLPAGIDRRGRPYFVEEASTPWGEIVPASDDEERARPYLWRFWRHLPRRGNAVVFDRSWYGRVLVERVEGFAREHEWRRAYQEINDFEEQLVEHGVVLLKVWLHVSPDEQLRRFEERQAVAAKQHKITAEDWRNREKWGAYAEAVDEMVARTSTSYAPWTLVAGNDKKHARVEVLELFCERLDGALRRDR